MSTNTKLKIAHITNCYESVPPINKAGLEQMVYYLIEGLVEKGHDVTLFGSADSQTSAKVYEVWPTAVSRDKDSQVREIGWYTHLAAREAYRQADQFDVIHDHTYFESDLYAKLCNTPVVSTMHHPIDFELSILSDFPEKYRKYAAIREYVASVVTVSKHQARMLKKHFNRKSTVIHNGIPEKEWDVYNPDPQEYFAYLGYISGFKGVAQAIQAILKTDKQLKIAGSIDNHDVASIKFFNEEVEPYLDSPQIEYLGPLDLTEKREFLRNAKATLMPIQWDEPFGLVAIESLACGTPVIANNRGALPEIIEHGISGLLVSTVNELAHAIHDVNALRREDARARYIDNFTSKKMVENYERLYYKLTQH